MPRAEAQGIRFDFAPRGEQEFDIAETFVVELVERVDVPGEAEELDVVAVRPELMPDGTIFVEFLPEAHFDFVRLFPAGAEGETADVDGAEVDPESVLQRLLGGGSDRFELQLCGRLAEHPVRGVAADLRRSPVGIVELRLFEADFGGSGVVAFEKLGFIPGLSGRGESGVHPAEEALVGGEQQFSLREQVEQQPVLPVAAHPDPVDESLIVGVHGDGVLAGVDELRQVHPVVEVVGTVAGGRPLRDENAVYIQFVVIVGADVKDHIVRCRQREFSPEEDVAVLPLRLNFRQRGAVELAMKHVLRSEVAELLRGDPVPGENFRFFLHGENSCFEIDRLRDVFTIPLRRAFASRGEGVSRSFSRMESLWLDGSQENITKKRVFFHGFLSRGIAFHFCFRYNVTK